MARKGRRPKIQAVPNGQEILNNLVTPRNQAHIDNKLAQASAARPQPKKRRDASSKTAIKEQQD